MKKSSLATFGAAAIGLLFASAAPAAELNGWYAAWDVGFHFDGQSEAAHSAGLKPDGTHARWELRYSNDWAAFARLGYRWTPHIRT